MSNEVQAAQQQVIEEFSLLDDWMDRYQYLIDLGRRLPEFPRSSCAPRKTAFAAASRRCGS